MKGKLSVPLGFKFAPKPREIMEFLSCKAMGKSLPCDGFILENLDLYKVEDPGQLFEGEGAEREVVYAFIKWKKHAGKGKRFDRRVVGNSTWKSVVSSRPVYGTRKQEGKVIIGWSRTLKFHTKKKLRGNHDYIIHEFSLDDSASSHPEFKDYVVCRIKRKPSKKKSSPEENWPQSHSSALPIPNEYHENIISMPTFTHQNASGTSLPPAEGHQYQQNSYTDDLMGMATLDFELLEQFFPRPQMILHEPAAASAPSYYNELASAPMPSSICTKPGLRIR